MNDRIKDWIQEGFGIDYRSLVALRAGAALALLLNLFFRFNDITAFYSDQGLLPRKAFLELSDHPSYFCVYMLSGHVPTIQFLFLVSGILAIMLLVGYRTRVATILSWFLLASLQERNPMVIDGQDQLLRMILFWGIFLPWGNYVSIDSTGKERPDNNKIVFNAATVAYCLQIMIMYWMTAWKKSGPEWRVDGSAGIYALNMDFATTAFGAWLAHFPEIIVPAALFSYWLEVIGPFLLVIPACNGLAKTASVIVFALFHIGLSMCFVLGLFPFIDCVALAAFLPASFWAWLAPHLSRFALYNELTQFVKNFASFVEKHRHPPQPLPELWQTWQARLRTTHTPVVSILIALMIYWNLITIPNTTLPMPAPLLNACVLLRMDQNWEMFASFIPQVNGWYVIPAKLANGEEVDLHRKGAAVTYERPEVVSDTFGNDQWNDYLSRVFNHRFLPYRKYWAAYLCRKWNKAHDEEHQIVSLTIWYMYEGPMPETNPKDRENPEKVLVWEHTCDSK